MEGGWEPRVKLDDKDVEQMKGCREEKSWMIVAKCGMEREEEPEELIGNRGVEMRCFRITQEIKKGLKTEKQNKTMFLLSWELVHAEPLTRSSS